MAAFVAGSDVVIRPDMRIKAVYLHRRPVDMRNYAQLTVMLSYGGEREKFLYIAVRYNARSGFQQRITVPSSNAVMVTARGEGT